MVERSHSCRTDRGNLSLSEHGYRYSSHHSFRQNPSRSADNGSIASLHGGINHYGGTSNSFRTHQPCGDGAGHGSALGSTSLHSRGGGCHSNKSFNKPKLTASNSGYDPLGGASNHSSRSVGSFQHSYKRPEMPPKHQYLAMDCEMVGTITGASVAARVVLIDWKGRAVLDTYMKPDDPVSDYRTFVSGITREHLDDAPTFAVAVEQVKEMLQEKILVGHGVDNDLRALAISHPWLMTRDTAYYQPFMQLLESSAVRNLSFSQQENGVNTPVWGPRKLKELTKEKLQRDIQVAGVSHCPVEDAAAALDLYKSHRPRWEACMSTEEKQRQLHTLQMAAAQAAFEMANMMQNENMYQASSPNPTINHFPSRSPSTCSSVSSVEDLSASMHSYFDYQSVGRHSQYPSPISIKPSTDPQSLLDMQYMGLGGTVVSRGNSLASRSQHGAIGSNRPLRRSASGDMCEFDSNQQLHFRSYQSTPQRSQLQRHVSMGYPTSFSSLTPGNFYSNQNQ